MQLLKQIWNERRSNGWLWAELLIVFVVLWYIVDWTYATARTYYEPLGYDITNTYYLELSLKNNKSDSYIPKGQKETTTGQDIVELTNRLRRLPEVEAVSISVNARPYIGSNSGIRFRLDTLVRSPLRRPVTPEFFQVFRYQSADGQGYQPLMQAIKNGNAVLSENIWPDGYKGDRTLLGKEVVNVDDSTDVYKIAAVSTKVRYNDFWPNYSDRYMAIPLTEAQLAEIKEQVIEEKKQDKLITDNTQINVKTEVIPGVDANGKKILNYKVGYQYEVINKEFSAKEDFPSGGYNIERSNAAMSLMKIIKNAFEGDFAKYLSEGKQVKVIITGSADAAPIRGRLAYDGRYGEFVDEPYYKDGNLDNITVTKAGGITQNEQLALMRAAGVKTYIEKNVTTLGNTKNEYEYHVEVAKERGGEFRKINVEFVIMDAFQ